MFQACYQETIPRTDRLTPRKTSPVKYRLIAASTVIIAERRDTALLAALSPLQAQLSERRAEQVSKTYKRPHANTS